MKKDLKIYVHTVTTEVGFSSRVGLLLHQLRRISYRHSL